MVDLQTYRCRIGCFITRCKAGETACRYKSQEGAVPFIKDLLLMSGVEPNPGPDVFVFRYQYLLVEVGTAILRKKFDQLVLNDFMAFLNADITGTKYNHLQHLILRGVISDDQKIYLPPLDMKPNSSNFDITLLSLLLRNVCGLRQRNDPVWTTIPSPGDMSIEADIFRMRKCRNDLQHRGTVLMSKTEFDDKWKELCKILHRLNVMSGGPKLLQSMISKAETVALDEKLKEKLEATINAWEESDKQLQQQIDQLKIDFINVRSELASTMKTVTEIQSDLKDVKLEVAEMKSDNKAMEDEVKREVDVLKADVGKMKVQTECNTIKGEINRVEKDFVVVTDNVKEDVRQVKCEVKEVKHEVKEMKTRLDNVQQNVLLQPSTDYTDVQKDLILFYKQKYKALPVSPLFENKDENILKMYQRPTMWSMEGDKQQKEVTYYQDIFYNDGKLCKQICISGDAGMGKTSLCRFICFLWSVGKQGEQLDNEDEINQKDIDTLRKFDFLFYINLRDTECCDVIGMIKEQYLNYHDPREIQTILRTKQCLILLDGLDEWNPIRSGKKRFKLPSMMHSENCVYLMTSRPYRLERERLSKSDCDHYIQTKGLKKTTTITSYVNNVISYMNKEHSVNKNADSFLRDVKKCGLNDQLCIPIMLSHLVVLWFEKGLTAMTRALVYGNILEMLFQRAGEREVEFPPITESKWHIPESFSGFEFLNKYVSLLYNICHLSFRSLFNLDEHSSGLVFTRQQLREKPYCFSNEESDFLCKIGILSKNELFGWVSVEKLKISFIHKSYIEFFASLFVTSFDRKSEFVSVIQTWEILNEVVCFKNFFILLAGLSYDKLNTSIKNIYTAVSANIEHIRREPYYSRYYDYLDSFQYMVINCYVEIKRNNQTNIAPYIEDYNFHSMYCEILKEILLLNKAHIKHLYTVGSYLREFDQITTLHCLSSVCSKGYDSRFTECMIRNASTLHTLCIYGSNPQPTLELTELLPVSSLQCLTVLTLSYVRMSHDSYLNLMTSLSEKVTMETIKLYYVKCHNHMYEYAECNFILNLSNHSKLSTLSLHQVNITCNNVNTSSLKSVVLVPFSHSIVLSSNVDLFDCLKFSQLEQLYIHGENMVDDNTLTTLTSTIRTLRCLKSLTLGNMALPVDANFLLNPDIKLAEIELWHITMSRQCLDSFIDSFKNNTSVITVRLSGCRIKSQEQGRYKTMSQTESVKFVDEHLSRIQTINITGRNVVRLKPMVDGFLHFQTTGGQ